MAEKTSPGILAIWNDIDDAVARDYEAWYQRQHLYERVSVPGFRYGRRYVAVDARPKFFTYYETDTPEALTGGEYVTYTLSAGWASDTRDSFLLPTKGSRISLVGDVSIPGGDLTYYRVTFRYQHIIDLTRLFAIRFDTELGYGDGFGDTEDLPLTENYFAGGLRSVRAYEANTLGPRDSNGEPLGGDHGLEDHHVAGGHPGPEGGCPLHQLHREPAHLDVGQLGAWREVVLDDLDPSAQLARALAALPAARVARRCRPAVAMSARASSSSAAGRCRSTKSRSVTKTARYCPSDAPEPSSSVAKAS